MSALCLVLLFCCCQGVQAAKWPWSTPKEPAQRPHPSVVRVIVEEPDGISHGSGTLVDVRGQFGMVITNWHVVRDGAGPINVIFPDSFRSAARILRVDRDWDLAALLIWRPTVSPVPLAPYAPRPGDILTIAGYGTGDYRAATGRCTQYVAPGEDHPFEMVEVATTARQGDSGGPIFNANGELAGVLFGSGDGTTSGSYAGRVSQFLNSAWPPQDSTGPEANLAARPPSQLPAAKLKPLPSFGNGDGIRETSRLEDAAQLAPLPAREGTNRGTLVSDGQGQEIETSAGASTDTTSDQSATFTWEDLAGESTFQQAKTVLALVGLFAIFVQFTRFANRAPTE